MISRFASLALLPLVACGGSVTLEDVDGFGVVASAVWLHEDDTDSHQLVLSNVSGLCERMNAVQEAYDDYEDALEDLGTNDMDEYCAVMEEPTLALARATDAIGHDGAHFLSFTVYQDGDTEPDEETYDVGGDPSVQVSVTYWENSPSASILSDYDADADDTDCGVDADDLEASVDTWTADDGELDITALNDEASLRAVFEGELVDPDGDGAGDIAAQFTATYCEIE